MTGMNDIQASKQVSTDYEKCSDGNKLSAEIKNRRKLL